MSNFEDIKLLAEQGSVGLTEATRLRAELDAIKRERPAASPSEREKLVQRAETALEDAIEFRNTRVVTVAALRLAEVYIDSGRESDALDVLERHEETARKFAKQPLWVSFAGARIRAWSLQARTADTERRSARLADVSLLSDDLIALTEEHRAKVSVPAQASAFTRFSIQVYADAVEARFLLDDIPGALGRAELVKCRSIHRMLPAADESAADLAKELQQFHEINDRMEALVHDGSEPDQALVERRRVLWDVIAMRRYAERSDSLNRFDLTTLQAALPMETVVVSWFWLDRERWLVAAIDADGVSAEVVELASNDRSSFDAAAKHILEFTGAGTRSSLSPPRNWTDVLFPATIRDRMRQHRRLILSPHRVLHALPLHACRWDGQQPLIRTFAVSYAPNLTTLQRRIPAVDRRSVLFVGASDPAHRKELPRLPGSVREHKGLHEYYGDSRMSSLLQGTRSELDQLNREGSLAEFGILHFACHGMNIDSDNPMESYLVLGDSDLVGLEISQWGLDADLVVLSACSAGQRPTWGRTLRELPGDELFGLQAAFFAAGARRILAGRWPVLDDVAPAIVKWFHEALEDEPADVALQKALLQYLGFYRSVKDRELYPWGSLFLTLSGLPDPNPQPEHRA